MDRGLGDTDTSGSIRGQIVDLRALAALSYKQEAFIMWLRAIPDCDVVLSVKNGEPSAAKAQQAMLPPMTFHHADVGALSGAELAILAAAQDLGYGTINIKIAAHLVQGWCVGEQSVIFVKDSTVDNKQ